MKSGVVVISFPPFLIPLTFVSTLPTRSSLSDSHGQSRDSWKGQSQHIELGESGWKGCTMGLCLLGESNCEVGEEMTLKYPPLSTDSFKSVASTQPDLSCTWLQVAMVEQQKQEIRELCMGWEYQ